jgi:intein/homing endonuclease
LGGLNSDGSTIRLVKPSFCSELAEFVGAVLGDGHVHFTRRSSKKRKIGVYHVKIAGDLKLDEEYHNYLAELSKSLFNLDPKFTIQKTHNERFLCLCSRELVEFFMEMGIQPGNKIINQSTIPKWIYRDNSFLKACLRGLIDTDGCIHRMSKKDPNLLRINLKNHDYQLLKDARNAFILLGFNPSKIIRNNVFYISRQGEISKYLKEIGFSNKRHLDRLNVFKSSVV